MWYHTNVLHTVEHVVQSKSEKKKNIFLCVGGGGGGGGVGGGCGGRGGSGYCFNGTKSTKGA